MFCVCQTFKVGPKTRYFFIPFDGNKYSFGPNIAHRKTSKICLVEVQGYSKVQEVN